MSEPPVGPNYRDTGRPTRYIPPPPVVREPVREPVRERVQAVRERPVVTRRPAAVQRPVQRPVQRAPMQEASSRKIASTSLTNESFVPRVKTKPSKKSRQESASASNWVLSGFYNLARETSYSGSTTVSGQSQSYSATESSAPGIGLAGAYVYRPFYGFGFSGQLGYEFNRTATKLSGSAGGQALTSDYGGGYTTSTFTGALNGSYSFGRVHMYGGLNYPYITGSSAVQLTGLPGYQIGTGYMLTRRLSIHAEYRAIRMKGSLEMPPTRLEVDDAQMRGFILSVDFSL